MMHRRSPKRASENNLRARLWVRLGGVGALVAALVLSGPGLPVETPAAAVNALTQTDEVRAAEAQSAELDGSPSLRWQAVDADGAVVSGATFLLQGPSDVSIEDDGADSQWADALAVEIEDNTGQEDYSGLDEDPAVGEFFVTKLGDSIAVEEGMGYRVKAVEAEGFRTGDNVEWVELVGVVEDGSTEPLVADVTLDAIEDAQSRSGEAEEGAEAGLEGPIGITPFAVGPDGGTPPYVYWETRDENNNLIGGATYQLQGPRTSTVIVVEFGVTWNTQITVPDCISAPCAGPDLDPDPGEFLVKQIGNHNIVSSNRYRVRQVTPPAGYNFTVTNNNYREIPGTRNTPTGWSSQTYNFGNFPVRAIPPMSPTCDAGYVYGIRTSGQIVEVAPNGAVTTLGSAAPSGGEFNGIGIGSGGSPVYGYSRNGSGTNAASSSQPRIYEYDTTSGTWSSTGVRVPTANTSGVTFVAGAVDLNTGNYLLGGYTGFGDNRVFRLWEYAPGGTLTYKWEVPAPGNPTFNDTNNSYNNGDIAFNANGDLFIVRGYLTNTWIYSVTAANLAAANGGTIPSSPSEQMSNTSSGVNGVAFDASGKAYLGAANTVRSYDLPNWSGGADHNSTSLLSSTDLASCSSPATITIEKYVQGARVGTNDQFRLSLTQGTTTLGTATTTGQQPGLQGQRVGPQPTVRGVTLNFSESASGTTNMNNYASSWSCYVDGEPMTGVSGTGTSGSVTIPSSGDVIECRFTNAPLVADVTVSKTLLDANGENPQPGPGWTVGAGSVATTGTVTQTPSAATQQTSTQGNASWSLRFNNSSARATVAVSETQQEGYEFVSGECAVVSLDGSVREVVLTSETGTNLTGVAPGDMVACEYMNKPLPRLTLVKEVTNPEGAAGYAAATDWILTATGTGTAAGTTLTGATGALAVTSQYVPTGSYALTETFAGVSDLSAGYTWESLVCVNTANNAVVYTAPTQGGVVSEGATLPLTSAIDVTCTYTNSPKSGTVTWQKVDNSQAPAYLAGSEWKIVGPAPATTEQSVVDCVGTGQPSAAACAVDSDVRPGHFEVRDLIWGNYQLIETRAPAGYQLDSTPRQFTVGATSLSPDFDPIVNTPITPPALPLTGGLGRDFFALLGGGVLILGLGYAIAIQLRKRRREIA